MVSKVFEKLLNSGIVDHLEKCDLFSDFQYSFRSSQSTADLLTIVPDRITTRAFNRSRATQAVVLDIFKAFDRVWHTGLLHKLKSYEISSEIFGIIFYFLIIDGFEWFWMESFHKNIQLMLEFSRLHSWSYTFATID